MYKTPSPRWLLATLALVVLGLLAGGAWFYRTQEQALRQEAERDLQAIAQLKVDQIAAWRAERLADAAVIMESPFFAETATRWLADPQPEGTEQILVRFRSRQYEQYFDVLLVDAGGQVRLSLSGQRGSLHTVAAQAMTAAFHDRQPVLTDLHAGPGDLPPHLDVVVPLFAASGQASSTDASEPVGAVILQSDARQFLYPLIQSWPMPSRSAETLLVRREGDDVLFLNDLRHQANTALTLRFPLTQSNLPAVMAVLGRQGIVEGVDYRGVQVLSALLAVPNSSWFMVAKVDTAEALTAWRTQSVLILTLILVLVMAAAASVGVVWQRNAKAHYRALLQVEAARQESEARYRATLLSVGDGVITTDVQGCVELLNPVAEALTGWPQAEAHGRPLPEVFHIIHEETRRPVENPVQQVLREGLVVGLANHTLLIARDGTEHPIADSGAPIHDENGALSGVVLVFRDQSEERATIGALTESEERYRTLFENAQIGIYRTTPDGHILIANPALVQMLGYSSFEELATRNLERQGFEPDYQRSRFKERIEREGQVVGIESQWTRRDGSTICVSENARASRGMDEAVLYYEGTVEDITTRKQAEEEIQRLNAELEDRVVERTAQLEATNHELESFSYSVSHDLRAPLRAVDGYARILEEDYYDRLDDEGRRVLGVVRSEAQRMGQLIDDLLAFSRLGRQELHRVDVDMAALAREAFAALCRQAPDRAVELRLADLPPAEADPALLRQVWANLLGNALKFSRDCTPAEIEVGGSIEDGEVVYFVQDNGVGFDMQYADKLFGVFQRLHGEDEFEGTGVGLALVQRIIHRHGGRVWAQAELDRGARITFALPRRKENSL